MLVNGKIWPYRNVDAVQVKLMVLNGCNGRILNLTFSNSMDFHVVAADVAYLPEPQQIRSIIVAPGERVTLVVDFSQAAGQNIILHNFFPGDQGLPTLNDLDTVMQFRVSSTTGSPVQLPSFMNTLPSPGVAVQSRDVVMARVSGQGCSDKFLLNNMGFDEITEFPVFDSYEEWVFDNPTSHAHPMHMHLVSFRVLKRVNTQTNVETLPAAHETGLKDTVLAYASERTHVLVHFAHYYGRFVYHCHNYEHEDHEMMRQFRVVKAELNPSNDFLCSNGNCDVGEDCFNCPQDCARHPGGVCGNNICDAADGEDCENCPQDCGGGSSSGYACCGLGADDTCDADGCFFADDTQAFFCRAMMREPSCCGDTVCDQVETISGTSCPLDCS
jgi:spore coat protein A